MKWEDLIADLSCIHLGEWKTRYDDPDVCDGVQWSVEIIFDNGFSKKHLWGSNKFPYNFDRFLEVMQMERD